MKKKRRGRGFTLVEMLAGMAVLTILGLFIAALLSMTHTTIRAGNRLTTADADARLALDRLGLDLAGLPHRTDADFWAANPAGAASGLREVDSGNRLLVFLSGVSSDDSGGAPGGNRGMSLVAYQVAASPNNPGRENESLSCLLRAGKAVGWSEVKFFGLKSNGLPVRFSDTGSEAFPPGLLPSDGRNPSDFDVLAPGVIRMVVGFQLAADNGPVALDDGSAFPDAPNARGQIVYSPPVRVLAPRDGGTGVPYIDLDRISALIVGLVAVDHDTLKLLSASQVAAMAGRFGVPAPDTLPVQAWQTAADGLVTALSGSVPLPALQSLHIYERAYPLAPPGDAGFGEGP